MINYLKKKNILITVGIIIILCGIFVVFLNKTNKPATQEKTAVSQNNIKQEVTLVISRETSQSVRVVSDFHEGITAFNLLKSKAEELNINLKTKSYENLGVLVEAIGDTENGQDGKYWLYYVNGEMPQVAADKYLLKTGDKVEFKFEKSPF